MAEIKEFKPSTKERPKPEKPANVVSNEELEKRRREILLQKEQKEAAKSPGQIKGEAQQRFIDKIKGLRKQFGKEEENE